MYKTLLLLAAVFTEISCQKCENSTVYNLTTLQSPDGELEHITSVGKIKLEDDAFGIYLKNDRIPKLCSDIVDIDQELTFIEISNCSLAELEKHSLKIIPTLSIIKITNNLLDKIVTNVFNNVKVKEIDLSHNLINTIEATAFDNITNLEIVKLNYNLLKEIDGGWFLNTSIYKLSIIYNELTELNEDSFKNFVTNKPLKLRLSANQITKIHAAIFGGRNIAKLRLNGNKLAALPSELCVNSTIHDIQINTNDLKCFPTDFLEVCNVAKLGFFENLSFECGCLKKVRKYVEANDVAVVYPSIICEDKNNEVQVVFNINRTYEIPLIVVD